MSERCPTCDKPVATQADFDAPGHGDGDGCECAECCALCWGDPIACKPIDWRARALAAEKDLFLYETEVVDRTIERVAAWLESIDDESPGSETGHAAAYFAYQLRSGAWKGEP